MRWCAALLMAFAAWTAAGASALDEFKIKREQVFSFAEKPKLTRQGDRVTITFETKGYCDATVAIENTEGKIIRHLASGVLGEKAPAPFLKGTKKQTLIWDGKDDHGVYIDDKDSIVVRVSLGLKPRFERTLNWSPKKRFRQGVGRWGFVGTPGGLPTPRLAAAPEGVYVFEGRGFDHLRLFDHDGNYVRTVYPSPGDKVMKIRGLKTRTYPWDGETLPMKHDWLQTTMLTSGTSCFGSKVLSQFGDAATALAVRGKRIALLHRKLNRLATDGTSGGMELLGPAVHHSVVPRGPGVEFNKGTYGRSQWIVSPSSAVFSPDGKYLYCTGYMYRQGRHSHRIGKGCFHGVVRLNYETNDKATVFCGSMRQQDMGKGNGQFRDATSVDCDSKGRVYVSDYANDRIQVFSPEGKHLKNISIFKPAIVRVHRKTNEIYVFSWVYSHYNSLLREKRVKIPPVLTHLGTFEKPGKKAQYPLPLHSHPGKFNPNLPWGGLEYNAEIDSWSDKVRIWLVPGVCNKRVSERGEGDEGGIPYVGRSGNVSWEASGIKLYEVQDGKLVLLRDFGKDARKAVDRLAPPMWGRQRLYVNPTNGKLYVAEGQTGHYKHFHNLLEIEPETGKVSEFRLPFTSEDVAFDSKGHIYLMNSTVLVRYDPERWRQVPFDYGETNGKLIGVIPLYNRTGWHKGGLHVNMKGDVLLSVYVTKGEWKPGLTESTKFEKNEQTSFDVENYVPQMYPGRVRLGEIHLFDKFGKLAYRDVVMGLTHLYGIYVDEDRDIYVLYCPTRGQSEKVKINRFTGTLMKFPPGEGRILHAGNSKLMSVPLGPGTFPTRPRELGNAWVDGADWFYGGIGYMGKNEGLHCSCYNCRFTLDYYARSFAPETDRYKVAVLDSEGNLIMRIGKYGNVDDGKPLIADGGPKRTRSVGGDEVALMHGAYVATLTDKKLYIADPGNMRILSVKLGYHEDVKMPLAKVPDQHARD